MVSAEARPVLVVDDDEVILESIQLALLDEGYTVVVASNGQEALERAREHSPSLILLDMKMPVMDGWTFAAAYREWTAPRAPIVVMTAAHDSRARAAEIGADSFLAKPFDLDHLLDLVRRFTTDE